MELSHQSTSAAAIDKSRITKDQFEAFLLSSTNEAFDTLLAEALSIADADQRREVMAKIQTLMQEEGVVIQPYWRSIYRHYRPGVVGAEMHPTFEIHVSKLGFAA